MDEIEKKHHVERMWDRVMRNIYTEMIERQVQPSQTVVLLPYAQIMPEARAAWLRTAASSTASETQASFLPRFETTMNWTQNLKCFQPSGDDLRLEVGRDLLTAASLLSRAGLAKYQHVLSGRLIEAAWSLARIAAAVPPTERTHWGAQHDASLAYGMEDPVLALEVATARIALAWAANSSYPCDPIFSVTPDLLVLLKGFQSEPLTLALQQTLAASAVTLPLVIDLESDLIGDTGVLSMHAAQDEEDEAHSAAACVLAHLAAGRSPVALVAQDRLLTRRVCAMLVGSGVAMRDETGWKLSTTKVAASLMSLLRAQVWDASTDAILGWLKNAPAFDLLAVRLCETSWRRAGIRDWRSVPLDDAIALRVQAHRDAMQSDRTLPRWLADLRHALQGAGQWPDFLLDPAGQAVLDALRLRDGAELEFADNGTNISLNEFTSWVNQTLEGISFMLPHPSDAQVVVVPLSQLLGRTLAAVVLPGCDEHRLPVSPEPPGRWTAGQRALLGLPSRELLTVAERTAWRYALQFPYVDVLWRLSDAGEPLMASGFIQELGLQKVIEVGPDRRPLRTLAAHASVMPAPSGEAFVLSHLSSTAYEDLRQCPYRFFALRQLKLRESDELDSQLDKRDFGNWMHHVLKIFHETLSTASQIDSSARVVGFDKAARQATLELGLSESEFLPFSATWPRVRDGYLRWLAGHEASGATFLSAETWRETMLGQLTLVGKIDRIDRLANGSLMVIDYKTENPAHTAQRIKDLSEDTQLAFYAALLTDDTLTAAYVNVGEKDGTKSHPQINIVDLRDQLIEGIVTDMERISNAAPMAAIGEGKACEFCAARGLCRKDFWEIA